MGDAMDAASFGYSGDGSDDETNSDLYSYISDHNSSDRDDLSSRPRESNYMILSEQDIRKRQEDDISEISTVLQVSNEAACLLLLHYNWSVSKVHEDWFADEGKVRNAVGILLETPKVMVPGNKKFKCGICFDKFTFKYLQDVGCDHLYCNSCWKGYITTSINDGPGCLTLRCPEPSCAAAVGQDMMSKFATDKDKEKYTSFLLRSYVENSRKIKWCPAPGCGSAVEFVVGSESYDVICSCSCEFCWNCKEEAHRPVDCETVANWIRKNSSESENTNWILVNTKPCPKCKRSIEKNQGCNHMTCGAPCKFYFCWICLIAISEHRGACNGYRGDDQVGNVDEFEKRRLMAKKALDRYTHYYERWAANNSSLGKSIEDLNKLQNVHLEELSKLQGKPVTQLVFVVEAWQQIVECRRVLKWTYAYGYYLCEQELNEKLKFFEHLQGQAESGLERLHLCAEKDLSEYIISNEPSDGFNEFRRKLTNLTSVTRNYFENLVDALENGLSEVIVPKDGI